MAGRQKRNESSDTDVVAIRMNRESKIFLQDLAKKEGRTFAGQVRFIVDEWAKKKFGKGFVSAN